MNTPAELVTIAHKRQLALRFEVSALEAAVAAGYDTPQGQYGYALTWLAEYAAGRVLELSKADQSPHPWYINVPWLRDRIKSLQAPFASSDLDHGYDRALADVLALFDEAERAQARDAHGSAVPTKDAATSHAASPAPPDLPRAPSGGAGATPRASRK